MNSLQLDLDRCSLIVAKQLDDEKMLLPIDRLARRPLGKLELPRIEFVHGSLAIFMYRVDPLYKFIDHLTTTIQKGVLINLRASA